MKRLLITVFAVLFATGAGLAPAAWAQTQTPPAPPKADAPKADTPKPADPAKLKDGKKADADKDKKVEKDKDKKVEKKNKAKQQVKGKDDKKTGLDRADQAAGEHGAQGRETAREKQGRK